MKSRSMSPRIEGGKILEAAKLWVGFMLGAWRGRRPFLAVTIEGQVILRKTCARHQLTIIQTLVIDKELEIVRTRETGCPWFADASLPSGNRLGFPLPASRHSYPCGVMSRRLDPINSIGQFLSITVGRNVPAEGILQHRRRPTPSRC